MKRTEPEFYPPVENLLDLIYEHYTENNPAAPKATVAGRAAKAKEKELEKWLRGLDGMDRLVEKHTKKYPRLLRRGCVFLFFWRFSFLFLLRCDHFVTGVDCHTHAA